MATHPSPVDLPVSAITDNTFVLVHSTWPVARGREVVEHFRPTHVVVFRRGDEPRYYLYSFDEFRSRLGLSPDTSSLHEALDLHEYKATPLIDANDSAESAPDRAIVHIGGRPIGFVDATQPPSRGPTRSANGQPEADAIPPQATLADRTLTAELPDQLVLDRPTSLVVYLSAAGTPLGKAIPVPLPEGTAVHVVVQSRRGISVKGESEGTLTISSADQTRSLRFEVRGTAVGPAQVEVLAFHGVQELGAIKLSPTIIESSSVGTAERRGREQMLAPVSIRQPDLSLIILERPEAGGRLQLDFLITAADPNLRLSYRKFGPVPLQVDAFKYFQYFFEGIEELPLSTPDQLKAAERRLANRGLNLFTSVLPSDLQVLLWSLRDRIQFIQVHSEEAWIPWELCKLRNVENGGGEEGPFLGEGFAVTRWIRGVPEKPALKLSNLAVVAPEDSGLPYAQAEREYLKTLEGANRQVHFIEPTFLSVYDALASGIYDGWHFTGHGSFDQNDPNRSAIYLRADDPLTAEDVTGRASGLGRADPLVFFNACQIGRSGMSLTNIGGWAPQFLQAGAAAFIGTYWSVFDHPAQRFAPAVYDRLLSGVPIGKAVREARLAIKSSGDPTWLAYTVFANPLASVTVT